MNDAMKICKYYKLNRVHGYNENVEIKISDQTDTFYIYYKMKSWENTGSYKHKV